MINIFKILYCIFFISQRGLYKVICKRRILNIRSLILIQNTINNNVVVNIQKKCAILHFFCNFPFEFLQLSPIYQVLRFLWQLMWEKNVFGSIYYLSIHCFWILSIFLLQCIFFIFVWLVYVYVDRTEFFLCFFNGFFYYYHITAQTSADKSRSSFCLFEIFECCLVLILRCFD